VKTNPHRPWWLRKRFLLPVSLLAGLGLAVAVAFSASDASTIVVYNETGATLPPLLVRACGSERVFPALAERESVRLGLKPGGPKTPVHLELATDPAWTWDGESVRPTGGYRVTIRLWPDRQVASFTEISWWRRTFN